MADTLNLSTLAKHFSDEESAWLLVESIRWPNGEKACPHCGTIGQHYFIESKKRPHRATTTGKISYRRVWKCSECKKQFSCCVGTIFEDTKLPLSKWLLGIYLMCSGKNGVSVQELSRQLGITAKSAWHMGHRIRLAMTREPMASKLAGIVEADETYVGGVARGSGPGMRKDTKTPVFALVERGGQVRAQVMKRVTRDNIAEVVREQVEADATLMTDGSRLYVPIGREMGAHERVDHGRGEYVRDGVWHTNTVENFFGQLKRSLDGTHHHVGEDHLHRYVDEFAYRYNTRGWTDGQRLLDTLGSVSGRRLMYADPDRT